MIAVVPSMIRLSSATSRWTPSEPDYFEDLAGDALVDTRPAERSRPRGSPSGLRVPLGLLPFDGQLGRVGLG